MRVIGKAKQRQVFFRLRKVHQVEPDDFRQASVNRL